MTRAVIDIPERLARRPRDKRGLPIPATVLVDAHGKPDFRVNDIERWVHIVRLRCCALCGEPMGAHVAFIGGPLAHINRIFTDAGMHLECAQYAMATCPYLALPRLNHISKPKAHEGYKTQINELVSVDKPERFFIGVTKKYALVQLQGNVFIRADPWLSVEWHQP